MQIRPVQLLVAECRGSEHTSEVLGQCQQLGSRVGGGAVEKTLLPGFCYDFDNILRFVGTHPLSLKYQRENNRREGG